MAKIEARVTVDRPAEAVWRFISDPSNGPKYEPGVIEAKQTSSGPAGVGSTFQSKRTKEGIVTFRCTEYEPNRKFTLEITNTPISGTTEGVSIEGLNGKTGLTLTVQTKMGGFYRLVGPFVARSFKSQSETILSNVKRILESEPQS